jgi:hypothetical protein
MSVRRRPPRLFLLIKWLVMMTLLVVGCATHQKAQSDCKMEWTGRPPVQVDSCTGRREDLSAGWHWYDYVFGIPLGALGFYDPGRTAD